MDAKPTKNPAWTRGPRKKDSKPLLRRAHIAGGVRISLHRGARLLPRTTNHQAQKPAAAAAEDADNDGDDDADKDDAIQAEERPWAPPAFMCLLTSSRVRRK